MTMALTMAKPQSVVTEDRALKLAAQTIWKHLTPREMDVAREFCRFYGANPFVKDIHFFVFDAKDDAKRNVVPVLAIQQYRKTAARSGNFRPADKRPQFTYDETLVGPANPRGIVDCTVVVHQFAHGEWHDVVGYVRWDERAPVVTGGSEGFEWVDTGEVWKESGKPKRKKVPKGEVVQIIDPGKTNWINMPETMLAKCAEADAIRKGWPEQVAGSYVEGELDRAAVLELSAEEIITKAEQDARQERLGGPRLHVQWEDGQPLEAVPIGKFHARVDEFFEKNADQPTVIGTWGKRNAAVLQDFWAHDKNASLDIKQKIEAAAKVGE